jgi:phosphoglycerate dehydrogenase-like enzyme
MRVAFVGTFACRMVPDVLARLTVPCDVVLAQEHDAVTAVREADVVVTMTFNAAMGAAAGRLSLVQVPGAGLDRIDRGAIPASAILANAYGHEVGIAEWIVGAMLALSRQFARLDAALRAGRWESQWAVDTPPPPAWPELSGKTLGIVGYGRIGACLTRRARAFDMTILAMRRRPIAAEDDVTPVPVARLVDLLARSDFIALTLPLSADTRGLIGSREIAAMKPGAVLVNPARAEIVDEDALYDALAARRIAGAALDAWYRYPSSPGPTLPASRPFHELPNVLLSPHVSGWTEGMLTARASLIAENIARISRGESPANMIEKN